VSQATRSSARAVRVLSPPRRGQQEVKGAASNRPGPAHVVPFSIISWNIRSGIGSKILLLERMMKELKPDVICLQEIPRADATIIKLADTFNYKMQHSPPNQTACGGAMILVQSRWNAAPVTLDAVTAWREHCEAASCRITFDNGKSISVTSLYVRIFSEDAVGFGNFLRKLPDDAVVAGDFNAREPSGVPRVLARYKTLTAVVEERGLSLPPLDAPSMVGSDTTNDYFLLYPGALEAVSTAQDECPVLMDYAGSDHRPIVLNLQAPTSAAPQRNDDDDNNNSNNNNNSSKQEETTYRNIAYHRITELHKAQFCSVFRGYLQKMRNLGRLCAVDVERALLKAARVLPRSTPQPPGKRIWWTPEAESAYENSPVIGTLRKQKARIIRDFASRDTNPGAVWKVASRFLGRKPNVVAIRPPLRRTPDGEPLSAKERLEEFARTYAATHADAPPSDSVPPAPTAAATTGPAPAATINNNNNDDDVTSPSSAAQLEDLLASIPVESRTQAPVSLWELRTAIDSMATRKCRDFLRVKAEMFKLLDDASIEAMLPWVNRIIQESAIPPHWKVGIVTPLPKMSKEDKNKAKDLSKAANWRPISVTAIMARMCEHIVGGRIDSKWTALAKQQQPGEEKMRAQSQFAYRRNVSSSMPLAALSQFIVDGTAQKTAFPDPQANKRQNGTRQKDRTHSTLLITIDCVSAFTRANGATIVQSLIDLGLNAEAFWVGNFLLGRQLRVKEGDDLSFIYDLERGIPQGTVLGPLLWSIVVDSLLRDIERECAKQDEGTCSISITYADDINLAIRGPDPRKLIARGNTLLELVQEWSTRTRVPLAEPKATWIVNNPNVPWAKHWTAQDGELVLGQHKCTPGVEPVKLLGVTYSSNGNFTEHVDEVLEKAANSLRTIMPLRYSVSAAQRKILYESLVRSVLLYAAEAWFPYAGRQTQDRIERMHASGCRFVAASHPTADTVKVRREAGTRSFQQLVVEQSWGTAEKLKRTPDGDRDDLGMPWVVRTMRGADLKTAHYATTYKRRWTFTAPNVARDQTRCPTLRELLREDTLREHPVVVLAARPYAMRSATRLVEPVVLDPSPPDGLSKKSATLEQLSEANLRRLATLPADAIRIYTDGAKMSEDDPNVAPERRGCAGVAFVVYDAQGNELHRMAAAVGKFASVYTAETRALAAALQWLYDTQPVAERIAIITDSQSLLSALEKGPLAQTGRPEECIWGLILGLSGAGAGESARRTYELSLHFVFSHAGVVGNEEADKSAGDAARPRGPVPLVYTDARRHQVTVSQSAFDAWLGQKHAHAGRVKPTVFKNLVRLPVADERLLLEARTGVVASIGGDRHGEDEPCHLCGDTGALGRGGKTIAHVFGGCEAAPFEEGQDVLWSNPKRAVEQLRRFVLPAEALERKREAAMRKKQEKQEQQTQQTQQTQQQQDDNTKQGKPKQQRKQTTK
jgi:ribonuclease HI